MSNNKQNHEEKSVPPAVDTAKRTDDQFEKERAFTEDVLASLTAWPKPPEKILSFRVINLTAVGGLPYQVKPLPEVIIYNVHEAGSRVTALKWRGSVLKLTTINVASDELRLKMVPCILLLGPASICMRSYFVWAQGGHPCSKAPISECTYQINVLRDAFSNDPLFWDLGRKEQIQDYVFKGSSSVSRDLLTGPL